MSKAIGIILGFLSVFLVLYLTYVAFRDHGVPLSVGEIMFLRVVIATQIGSSLLSLSSEFLKK